jgi:hypothetical protein
MGSGAGYERSCAVNQQSGGHSTTMGPEKQPALFQSLEITPDRVVGNAKMTGQIIDADLAFGFHQLKQLPMTLSEGNTLVFAH